MSVSRFRWKGEDGVRRVLVVALCLCAPACRATAPERERVVAGQSERVRVLFEAMERGDYAELAPPALDWADIPALLARASSTAVLSEFPRNPISSQYEPTCSEGMVALWLVEGLRRGGGHASLNALCLSKPEPGQSWSAVSEANHARVLSAYRKWWDRVRTLPREQASAVDPLEGLGCIWH